MPRAVLFTDGVEPELMTCGMQSCASTEQLLAWLRDIAAVDREARETGER